MLLHQEVTIAFSIINVEILSLQIGPKPFLLSGSPSNQRQLTKNPGMNAVQTFAHTDNNRTMGSRSGLSE